MGVTIYRSTDASAPALSGTAGALISVLDACLVNGYGAKAALGWSKAFSGTNKAAYRQPAGTSQLYVQVIDDGSTPFRGARGAMVRGYETMTDVDTGAMAFPTASQGVNGVIWAKSGALDATARPWILVGDEAIFYLFVAWQTGSYVTHWGGNTFGDVVSYKPGDAYGVLLIGDYQANLPSYPGDFNQFSSLSSSAVATQSGKYMARSFTQLGSSVPVGFISNSSIGGGVMGVGSLTYPNPADNGFYVAPVFVNHNSALRGKLPGIYNPLHSKPLNDLDTVSNIPSLPGRTLLLLGLPSSSTEYRGAIDITGPWR